MAHQRRGVARAGVRAPARGGEQDCRRAHAASCVIRERMSSGVRRSAAADVTAIASGVEIRGLSYSLSPLIVAV